jgi:acetyl-CoA carboxylase carboxyl transferase subunit beta
LNWIKNFVRPKIRSILGTDKREVPENMWVKDPDSGQMVFYKDLEANQYVMPQSGYHMRMPPEARLKSMFDDGAYEKIAMPQVPADPLRSATSANMPTASRKPAPRTASMTAFRRASASSTVSPVTIAVQDFAFMGGSLGMAAGEAIITAMRAGRAENALRVLHLVGRCPHAGRRALADADAAHDGCRAGTARRGPSLYRRAHASDDGRRHRLLCHAGRRADSEPGALIGFAGQRVIEQTIREKLPAGFQRAEYLQEHGMVDMVIHRHEMRDTVSRTVRMLMKAPSREVPSTALVLSDAVQE